MNIKGFVLNRKENSTQIVLQACIPFTYLKGKAQFGYRVDPMADPYSSSSIFGDANNQYQR